MEPKDAVNVLLVDDDDFVVDSLSRLVEKNGWKPFKAPTGEIAIDSFKLNNIDVVVLDLHLPNMDGFEVLKNMKAIKPSVPVIILTGVGYEKEEVNKAVKLGAAGYIGKAMPVSTIIAKIRSVTGKK